MSDYHRNYADQVDARIKELEAKLKVAVASLESLRQWVLKHGDVELVKAIDLDIENIKEK